MIWSWLWLLVPEIVALAAWVGYSIGYDRGLDDCPGDTVPLR